MAEKQTTQGARAGWGLWAGNPLLGLALGICPALAVTTRAANGLGLGLATACVLILTSLVASILGKLISEKGRFPVFILISATFAALAQMVMKAWQSALCESLGVFVPLIAVNCLILNRSETFAAESGPVSAVVDSICMGLGYTLALTLVGILRELIGCGTIFGAAILPASYEPMLLAVMPAGGFLALGLMMGIYNVIAGRGRKGASK